jgi:Protein of unknown function (DUF5656)
MDTSTRRQNLPDIDLLSILAAMIVLAYTLEQFIDLPSWEISRQLPGLYIEFKINVTMIISLLVALMTAAGTNWLMREHPASEKKLALQHAILPALTSLVIVVPLSTIPIGIGWWIGLISGTFILVLVIIAEYISVDLDDIRLPFANAALSAVSFALFLILAGALRAAEVRLLFITPAIILAAWLVSLRVTNLRLHGEWTVYESAIIALLVGQVAAAFYYWPLAPITYALVLLGPSYALISLFCNLIEEKPVRQIITEPIISILIAWGAAFIIR